MIVNVPKEKMRYNVKTCCVYKLTNNLNNKIYVGQSVDLRKRISEYKNADKKHSTRPIMQALRDDGHDGKITT